MQAVKVFPFPKGGGVHLENPHCWSPAAVQWALTEWERELQGQDFSIYSKMEHGITTYTTGIWQCELQDENGKKKKN